MDRSGNEHLFGVPQEVEIDDRRADEVSLADAADHDDNQDHGEDPDGDYQQPAESLDYQQPDDDRVQEQRLHTDEARADDHATAEPDRRADEVREPARAVTVAEPAVGRQDEGSRQEVDAADRRDNGVETEVDRAEEKVTINIADRRGTPVQDERGTDTVITTVNGDRSVDGVEKTDRVDRSSLVEGDLATVNGRQEDSDAKPIPVESRTIVADKPVARAQEWGPIGGLIARSAVVVDAAPRSEAADSEVAGPPAEVPAAEVHKDRTVEEVAPGESGPELVGHRPDRVEPAEQLRPDVPLPADARPEGNAARAESEGVTAGGDHPQEGDKVAEGSASELGRNESIEEIASELRQGAEALAAETVAEKEPGPGVGERIGRAAQVVAESFYNWRDGYRQRAEVRITARERAIAEDPRTPLEKLIAWRATRQLGHAIKDTQDYVKKETKRAIPAHHPARGGGGKTWKPNRTSISEIKRRQEAAARFTGDLSNLPGHHRNIPQSRGGSKPDGS